MHQTEEDLAQRPVGIENQVTSAACYAHVRSNDGQLARYAHHSCTQQAVYERCAHAYVSQLVMHLTGMHLSDDVLWNFEIRQT